MPPQLKALTALEEDSLVPSTHKEHLRLLISTDPRDPPYSSLYWLLHSSAQIHIYTQNEQIIYTGARDRYI